MGQKVTKIKRGDGDPLVTRSRSDRNLASTPPAKEKPTDMPERAEGRIDLYSILSNNVVVMNLMQFLLPADLASLMVLSKSAFLYLSPPGETTLQSYRKIAAPKCLKCFGEVWRCDGFAVIAALYKNQPTGHYIHIVGDHACESETSGPNHGESRYIGIPDLPSVAAVNLSTRVSFESVRGVGISTMDRGFGKVCISVPDEQAQAETRDKDFMLEK
ncbi:MAG: hypothetical protein M1836_006769 [Candelina mexicana]|nr:MAG: hypothetical protein M1836_006769 [Candelina mexicana]